MQAGKEQQTGINVYTYRGFLVFTVDDEYFAGENNSPRYRDASMYSYTRQGIEKHIDNWHDTHNRNPTKIK